MEEISQEEMVTLLSSLMICTLMSIESQLPEHSLYARRVKGCEEAIQKLASLNGAPLSDELVDVGTKAFNKMLEELQSGLTALNNP